MALNFPTLLSPVSLGPLEIPNRIVFTAHYTKLAVDQPNAALAAYYGRRARGGAGLIVTEAASVHESGSFETMIDASSSEVIPGYSAIAEACHEHDCPVIGQLFHPGRETRGRDDGLRKIAWAPSALPGDRHHVVPKTLSAALIEEIQGGYASAAGHLCNAGLDGVELLASQGYLMAQFLSPRINQRTDHYGGALNNRLRFITEVVEQVRARIGTDRVVGIRLSADAKVDDGATTGEMLEICEHLESHGGLDYFSFVYGSATSLSGSTHIVPPMEQESAYVMQAITPLHASLSLPVIATGRINQPQDAERILASGQAEACGMTRALIADPDLPNKARTGASDDIRACIACNQACVGHTSIGSSVSCIQTPESGRERELGPLQHAAQRRSVLIAGGGPAGLKAAAVATERGHDVTLYEREARVGGQVRLAEKLPSRSEFGGLTANLVHECQRHGARIRTNVAIDRQQVMASGADVVIVATGSNPFSRTLPGAEEAHIVTANDVIGGGANVGSSVVIADWRNDWIGLGVAEMLAAAGRHVRLCVNGTHAGETLHMYVRDSLVARVHRLGVEIVPYARVFGADAHTIYFQHSASEEPMMFDDVDTLVLCEGHVPDESLAETLTDYPGELHEIGDCVVARTAEEAIYEGMMVARAL